jgi:Carboxypeptidase regulatory-like domain
VPIRRTHLSDSVSPRSHSAFALFHASTVFAISLVLSLSAGAQVDTGSIVGTVFDSQHRPISGAAVTLQQTSQSSVRTTKSGRDGNFSFSPLSIGTYDLTVESPGFGHTTEPKIVITAQSTVRTDVTLQVGNVSQTVDVRSDGELLETQSSAVQQLVDAKRINDLPLNGRNVTLLAQTAPGVTIAQQDTTLTVASGSFSANGARRGQNNYLLDGIDNNAAIGDYVNQSQYVLMPPPDALQEFVVQTSDYSAEFGKAAGTVLNASTKSGTDEFHGSFWEFFRNDALEARNYFATAPAKPTYLQNQFGFSIGGPVDIPKIYNGKHKTYFFFDYQGTKISQKNSTITTVPTTAERSANFTNFSDLIALQSGTRTDNLGRLFPSGTIFDPATSRAITAGQKDPVTGLPASQTGYVRDPFYSGTLTGQQNFTTAMAISQLNQLPAGRINPSAVALLNLYPSATSGGITNNYTAFPQDINNSEAFDIRLDQHLSNNDSAFARYSYIDTNQINPGPFPGVADGETSRPGTGWTQAQNVAVSETHIFNSHLVNEARFGYSRVADIRKQFDADNLSNIPGQYGINGIPQIPGNGGLPTLSFGNLSNLGTPGTLPSDKASDVTQASDNLTISTSRHVIRTGFLFEHIAYPMSTPTTSRGAFAFSGIYTSIVNQTDGSTDRAQFLINPTGGSVPGSINNVGGANSVTASSYPPIANLRRGYVGTYIQDDWRAFPSLTFNLGLRWEYFGAPSERDNRQANFVLGPLSNPAQGAAFLIPRSQVSLVPQAFLSLLAKDNIAFTPTSNVELSTEQYTNFAPRFGFAYQASSRLVLHGGFGIFYGGSENYGVAANPASNFPFNVNSAYTAANAVSPVTPDNSVGTLQAGLTNVPLSAASATLTGASRVSLLARQYNWKNAYTGSYNLQLQYQLSKNTVTRFGYVGSISRHLQTRETNNAVNTVLSPNASIQTNSFFPDFATGGALIAAEGATNYNGFQIDVTRQFSSGLSAEANYTRSKCLGDARDILDDTLSGYRAPFVPGAGIGFDYGLCDVDVRNIFHVNGVYVLPLGRGKSLLANGIPSYVASGWSLQWIATAQDGQPFTIPCTATTAAGLGCDALKVAGQNPYAGPHNAVQFLNPAAFANPSATANGLAVLGGSPTQVTGPAYRKLDLSLFRSFHRTEASYVEIRVEAFNITNTPNFSMPINLNFTTPSNFAQITSTRDSARQLQLAGKFYW